MIRWPANWLVGPKLSTLKKCVISLGIFEKRRDISPLSNAIHAFWNLPAAESLKMALVLSSRLPITVLHHITMTHHITVILPKPSDSFKSSPYGVAHLTACICVCCPLLVFWNITTAHMRWPWPSVSANSCDQTAKYSYDTRSSEAWTIGITPTLIPAETSLGGDNVCAIYTEDANKPRQNLFTVISFTDYYRCYWLAAVLRWSVWGWGPDSDSRA